ncbi:MAG TPA: cation transporting ATPase C-terminal domain-containing protein, partial [Methylomirabilota bacterium]|nr:cation transporting ATPase C-terminal domain-containing protein [Methylomirabilota bacterium]
VVLIHPFQAMNCRSEQLGWWRLPRNGWIWTALLALVGLQWASVAVPGLSRLLATVPLGVSDLAVLAAGVLWPVVLMEIAKGSRARRLGQSRPTREPTAAPAHYGTPWNH